jgi:hypothetical protein
MLERTILAERGDFQEAFNGMSEVVSCDLGDQFGKGKREAVI